MFVRSDGTLALSLAFGVAAISSERRWASLGDQLWHQDRPNVPGSCQHDDQLARAVY